MSFSLSSALVLFFFLLPLPLLPIRRITPSLHTSEKNDSIHNFHGRWGAPSQSLPLQTRNQPVCIHLPSSSFRTFSFNLFYSFIWSVFLQHVLRGCAAKWWILWMRMSTCITLNRLVILRIFRYPVPSRKPCFLHRCTIWSETPSNLKVV